MLTAGVRRHPLLAFYLLAFAITWAAWLPPAARSRGLPGVDSPVLYLIGGIGPGLAAWVVLRVLHGPDADRRLFAPLLRWRVGVGWYAVAVLLPVAMFLASAAASGDLAAVTLGPATAVLVAFGMYLAAAVPEEVAWRGFALPRLQERHGALVASLVVGVLWALWHLPLLWNLDNSMSTYPLAWWFGGTVAVSVVYTWLFNSTGGSVAVVTVFHAVGNTVTSRVEGYAAEEALVTAAVALVLVALFGASRLTSARSPRPRAARPTTAPGRPRSPQSAPWSQ